MSVKIPSNFDFDVGLDLDVDISGIPTDYDFSIDLNLSKINIGLDPMQVKVEPIEIKPLDFSFRIKEIPSARVHLPVDYKVGLTLFGMELACVRLCGQGQVITETRTGFDNAEDTPISASPTKTSGRM